MGCCFSRKSKASSSQSPSTSSSHGQRNSQKTASKSKEKGKCESSSKIDKKDQDRDIKRNSESSHLLNHPAAGSNDMTVLYDSAGKTNSTSSISLSYRKIKLNLADFTFSKRNKEILYKLPNHIGGNNFCIEECEDCDIFLFDVSSQVTVDFCKNSRIFIGPCEGSVFLRDCQDCLFIVSCQQFRVRDCQRCQLYLHSTTQPVIESSSGIALGCFSYHYKELKDQFKQSKLSVYTNFWWDVYDFTASSPDENRNWSVLESPSTGLLKPPEHILSDLGYDESLSLVPYTRGTDYITAERSICLLFSAEHAEEFNAICQKHNLPIIRTRQIAHQVFQESSLLKRVENLFLENNDVYGFDLGLEKDRIPTGNLPLFVSESSEKLKEVEEVFGAFT